MNTTVDRIIGLMTSADITAKRLTETLDMSATAITDWKKGKACPSIDALKKIADYFHVSIDYLVYGTIDTTTNIDDIISTEEMQLIKKYRSLSEASQEKVAAYIDGMIASTTSSSKIYI